MSSIRQLTRQDTGRCHFESPPVQWQIPLLSEWTHHYNQATFHSLTNSSSFSLCCFASSVAMVSDRLMNIQ